MRECIHHGWHEDWYSRPITRTPICMRCNRERDKKRREANPRRSAPWIKRWAQEHPENSRQWAKARRRSYVKVHTEDEWQALCEALDHKCARCGQVKPLQRDHVFPLREYASELWVDHIANIQPLCSECNESKKATYADYRPQWLVDALLES